MLKVGTLILSLGLFAAPFSHAAETSSHEDLAAAPKEKDSHPDSKHAEADSHAPHKPRHGANLYILNPPKTNRENAIRPGLPTLQSPEALSTVSGTSAVLKWTPSKDAETYHVQVATDPNFKWLIVNEYHFKGTQFDAKNLEAGNQYFWRIAGMRNSSWAEYMKGDFVGSSFEVK